MKTIGISTDDTLKSTIRHGTIAFPFEYYLDEIHKYKNQCIEWHCHNEFEFTSVLTGPVDCLIGTDRLTLNSGDGLFINSGTVHRFESHKETVMLSILFAPEFIAHKETTIYQKYILPVMASDCKYIVLHKENAAQKHYLEILNSIYVQAKNQDQMRELEILILTASLWKELFLILRMSLHTGKPDVVSNCVHGCKLC